LILRANTDDDYAKQVDEEMLRTCLLNSAATIVSDDRENSGDPKVVEIVDRAEAIFIAGGDQSNYVCFWQDTPVQNALNRHIAKGRPMGAATMRQVARRAIETCLGGGRLRFDLPVSELSIKICTDHRGSVATRCGDQGRYA
jgi:hypothetical protein